MQVHSEISNWCLCTHYSCECMLQCELAMFSSQHLRHNFLLSLSAPSVLLCGLLSPSSQRLFSVCIPPLTMLCSRQRDAFRGRLKPDACPYTTVMWKNTVHPSHLHVLHFVSESCRAGHTGTFKPPAKIGFCLWDMFKPVKRHFKIPVFRL